MTKLDDKVSRYSKIILGLFETNDILPALGLEDHPPGVIEEAFKGILNSRTACIRKTMPPLKDSDIVTNNARVLWVWLEFLRGRKASVHSIMYHCVGWEHARYLQTVAELIMGKQPQCLWESQ